MFIYKPTPKSTYMNEDFKINCPKFECKQVRSKKKTTNMNETFTHIIIISSARVCHGCTLHFMHIVYNNICLCSAAHTLQDL